MTGVYVYKRGEDVNTCGFTFGKDSAHMEEFNVHVYILDV